MSKFLININGELFDETSAKISVMDRGFLYGDSVYEATRTFSGIPFRLDAHLDRLFLSAEKIELLPTLTKKEITERIEQTIKASANKDITLRIILSRGTNSDLGLNPELASNNNLVIITKPITPNPSSWLSEGVSVIFHQKKNSLKGSLPKTGNYQENILAHKAALEKGAFDALMISLEGHVTEGTTSNAWIVKNGVVYTPALSSGVLDGLTRRTLFEIAEHKNTIIKEAILTRVDFLSADECFLTSTTRNLVPVTKIENQLVGNGLPGAKTLELLKTYLEFVSSR